MEVKHITYINLGFRKVRNAIMEMQLSAQKIPFSRTPGVVCEDFVSYKVNPAIEPGSPRHKGTVGCFLAHKEALKKLASLGDPSHEIYLVLEDDVILSPAFWWFLRVQDYPEEADILFFNAALQYPGRPSPPKNERNLFKINQGYPMFVGAFAYAIKKSKIDEVLNKMNLMDTYGDVDLDFYYKEFKCYTIVTKTMSLRRFESDRDPTADFNEGRSRG
jgi:hypothetical protein